MPDCIIENLQDGNVLMIGLNGKHPQFVLRSEAISGTALADLEPELEDLLDIAADLSPGRPSFITRVWLLDSRRFRVGQARRVRCCQIAQAPGALRRVSGCSAKNPA